MKNILMIYIIKFFFFLLYELVTSVNDLDEDAIVHLSTS